MDRSLRWRTIGLVALVSVCLLSLLPSFLGEDALPDWYHERVFTHRMQLGLDLQGGLYIVYSIDLDTAVNDKASEIRRDVEAYMTAETIAGSASTPAALGAVTARVADPEGRDKVRRFLLSEYRGVVVERACPPGQDDAVCMRVSSDFADSIKKAALEQAVETIRSRIDERGIAEPTVITKGDDIVVELPGLDPRNQERIKDIIARAAKLEFKKVLDDDLDETKYMRRLFAHVSADARAKELGILSSSDSWVHDKTGKEFDDYYLYAHDREEPISVADAKDQGCYDKKFGERDGMTRCNVEGHLVLERYLKELATTHPELAVPDDRQVAFEAVTPGEGAEDKRKFWRSYYLDRATRLTGSSITNAMTIWDPQTNRPEVLVEFNRYGTRVFGDLTAESVGRKMAILLDNKVRSAPVIQSAIPGGRSNISMGSGNPDEQQRDADMLVSVLKTGSLPAPLRHETEAKLGPTLGMDAIQKTQVSFALGVVLVIIIMFGIYRWSGLIANSIIFINVILMLAVMSVFGATLTLPGIAAVVLTVGMVVDGNILIYERIRDELKTGKSVKGAVDVGFARAFSAILDAQLTTAAAGWVLLQYGSGPIQGFATMLLVGIGTTLFCNVWVTRLFFDWYVVKNKSGESLSI
jgi:preprotein translocase subunit SecD